MHAIIVETNYTKKIVVTNDTASSHKKRFSAGFPTAA